ncbi:MAG: NAD(P)H-hydrate dehydratase [Candidatus Wildermuthbacteria bacterium]|nr:NAD(P)H-hydrate dehydratase [Candidatus Wildermuthbacteria bacterium]
MTTVTRDILKIAYPVRPPEVKKYDYGLLLVIGGSEFYSGAPALAALAGFRAGVDMVRVIAPKRSADIIASFSPMLAAYPLNNSHVLKEHLATLLSLAESAKDVAHGNVSVVLGNGLGRSQETQETIFEFLKQTSLPVVIDGDGLHAVAKDPAIISGRNFILTPNTFEFQLVTGKEVRALEPDARVAVVKEEAARLGTTIVLKVKTDIISNGGEVMLNESGSPYMSIGGAGDTMAGIIGAMVARGLPSMTAAAAGAYINGKAGEIAAKKMKESLVVTDIIDAIAEAISQ